MTLRKLIFAAATAAVCLPLWGQTAVAVVADSPESSTRENIVENINRSQNIVVEMPQELLQRIAEVSDEPEQTSATSETDEQKSEASRPKGHSKIVGYRVQVYADNNARSAKAEARMRERAVGRAFPYSTYVTYSSPYWRLRVGDFRNQAEASKAAAAIRQAFPRYAREVRVVRDRVFVK